jgi:tetratricopeptide (TPR) repeat protein
MKTAEQSCQSCSDQPTPEHPIFDLCRTNRFDDALTICQREIADRPKDPTGYRHAAVVLARMDRHADARILRDKVVELAPDCTMSYYSRADLLYEMGEYAAAISDFTRSAELDHEQALGAVNYLYRADCHRRLGNYAAATADCALVDDFDFPGFLGQRNGSKYDLLAEIARDKGGARSQ